jgi:predicted dehydrogenase
VVDLVCWWLGGEPEVLDYADDSRGGTEAVARVRLRLHDVVADIHLSWLTKLRNAYRIVGERGAIEGGAYEWASFQLKGRKMRASRSWQGYEDFVAVLLDNFVDVIGGRSEPLVSAADVRPAIAVIDECYRRRRLLDEPWHDAWQGLFPEARLAAHG